MKGNFGEEIRSLICKLPDIISCRVSCSEKGIIEDIHILANTNRNVKQIVRDVQSAVNAQFDIDLDYKVISVAQISENDYKEERLVIDSITVKNIGNSIEASVILRQEENKYEGRSTKVKSHSNRFKAIAEATLQALENYIEAEGIFYLEAIQTVFVAGREVFVTVIGFSYKGKEEILSGSSIVYADENEAAVKAVLSAVNRRISNI